jgi:serralysin
MAIPVSNTTALLTDANNGNGSLADEFVSGLVQGSSWNFGAGPRVLTWSLNINELSGSYPGTPEPGPGGTWQARPDLAQAVESVFSRWAAVANIRFEHVGVDSAQYYFESGADIAVTLTGNDLDNAVVPGTLALGFFPDPAAVEDEAYSDVSGINRVTYPGPEGDVFLDNFDVLFEYARPGGSGYSAILHEIGHALGLKHPFDDGSNGRPTFDELEIGDHDRLRYTVMSYDRIVEDAPAARGFAMTPMPLDILAIQQIYGANLSYHAGDNTYVLGVDSFRTIWDAGGDDTVSAASWGHAGGVLIDLREGEFSGALGGAARTAIAYHVTLEDAIGSGAADRLIGNAARNFLDGGAGNDEILGGTGGDQLKGGAGADRLEGQGGGDVLVGRSDDSLIDGGDGFDTLRVVQGGFDLRQNAGTLITGIEQVNMTGAGTNRLTLSASAVLDLSPATNALRVLGDAGDTVRIVGDYEDRGLAGDFHRYRLGAAVLLVDQDVAVL